MAYMECGKLKKKGLGRITDQKFAGGLKIWRYHEVSALVSISELSFWNCLGTYCVLDDDKVGVYKVPAFSRTSEKVYVVYSGVR